jgi:hypothetical protein
VSRSSDGVFGKTAMFVSLELLIYHLKIKTIYFTLSTDEIIKVSWEPILSCKSLEIDGTGLAIFWFSIFLNKMAWFKSYSYACCFVL